MDLAFILLLISFSFLFVHKFLKKFFKYFYFMCVNVFCVNHVVQFQERPEKGDRLPENAVTGGCKLTWVLGSKPGSPGRTMSTRNG